MLSVEQRKYEQLYGYRGGMLNTAWIAGVARKVTARGGFIQQTNNLNQMIEFQLDDGDKMPSWVQEGVNIKVITRLHTNKKNGEPNIVLIALAVESPSIYDMPPRQAWERTLRPGVPSDEVRPADFKPDDAPMKMDGARVNDPGNMVKVAGFVSSIFVEPAGIPKEGGGVTQGCLVLTIRQTKDSDDLIPVRVVGKNPEATARRLVVGVPLKATGKLRVRLKNTGEPAGQDGVLPVSRNQYLHVTNLSVANRSDIREEPEWAKTMALESRSKRAANQAAKPKAAAQPTIEAENPAAPAPVQPVVLDANLPIDPALLSMMSNRT